MTNNKPPMFGPSAVIDPATYEPRSGKTFWMAATDLRSLVNKEAVADTIIGNCTTSIPLKFEFDPKDNGHTLMYGSTREGMSGMKVPAMLALASAFSSTGEGMAPSLLPLSAPSQFEASVLMAIGSQRNLLMDDGISLAALSRVLGMESTPEGDRRILDALQQLKRLVPALAGLRISEADGLVRAGDVHQ